jgi:YD repeat-containing protein
LVAALFSVTEPLGSGGANVTTFYGYDVGNRLASVSTTAAGITQSRSFTYDRAGLLQAETHPRALQGYQRNDDFNQACTFF